MPFGNKTNILQGSFQFSIVRTKKKQSGNPKFNYLGIFPSLKLRILMEKFLSISPKLNFTPNTLGCYGLGPGVGPTDFIVYLLEKWACAAISLTCRKLELR